MNQTRDIVMVILIALGIGLIYGGPENWSWVHVGGPYAEQALSFLITYKPFSPLLCFVLALTLFMTRLKY